MKQFIISKKFDFEFAHRVPTQNIHKELCQTCQNKCRRLHGHTGVIEIFLKAQKLDRTGMVTDYTNLKWFKKFIIDTYLDHKTIFSIKYDTLWKTLIKHAPEQLVFNLHIFRPQELKIKVLSFKQKSKLIKFLTKNIRDYELVTLHTKVTDKTDKNNEILDYKYLLDSFTLINNYTTAESLAKIIRTNLELFFNKYYNPKFKHNIKVHKVCFFETQNSSACI